MEDHRPALDADQLALIEASRSWSTEAKEKLAREVAKKLEKTRRVWFCSRGRVCDGKPHEGYPYKHARGAQWPPADNDWLLWFILSGRGFGKTRSGAEWVRYVSKYVDRIAMIGRRRADVRLTMVEGESGLIAVCENAGIEYDWRPSTLEFHMGRCTVFGYYSEEPDALRGPQHGAAWMDEPAHMENLGDTWDNLLFGLRLPGMPGGAKVIATGTPIGIPWIRERLDEESTRLTRGTTYDNLDNLDATFRRTILDKYEGTRTGRQELMGEVLFDVPGALWKEPMFHQHTMLPTDMDRIVVSVDPAGSAGKRSDETGIIVVGRKDRNLYVFEDGTGKYSPDAWAGKAINLYEKYQADAIVAEKNFGGDMVRENIDHKKEAMHAEARVVITHAARSKEVRAEPLVGMYEQGRVYHSRGLDLLENEQSTWVPGVGRSPNRVDAIVHGAAELMKGMGAAQLPNPSRRRIDAAAARPLGARRFIPKVLNPQFTSKVPPA